MRRTTTKRRPPIRPTSCSCSRRCYNDQGPQGVVEIFQRPGARVTTQRGYLRFLLQVCEFAGDFLEGRRLRHLAEKQTLWEQLETFTRTAHEKLDVRETAYTIANEGRRLIGCDRVSVAIRHGGSCPIEAVSGQDTFDKRSNVTVLLGKLATAVVQDGRGRVVLGRHVGHGAAGGRGARGVRRRIAHQGDGHPAAHRAARRGRKLARTKIEREPAARDRRTDRRADGRQPHAGRLSAARRRGPQPQRHGAHQRAGTRRPVPDARVAVPGQGHAKLFRGRTLPKTLAISAAVDRAASAFLCLIPTDFTLEGNGKLRPKVRQNVFAQQSTAMFSEMMVEHDTPVKKGEYWSSRKAATWKRRLETLTGELSRGHCQKSTPRAGSSIGDDEDDVVGIERAQKQRSTSPS